MQELSVIVSSFIGAIVGSAITAFLTPAAVNGTLDRFVRQLTARGTKGNVWLATIYEAMNTNPLTISEIGMRAETGEPLIRPAVTASRFLGFDELLLRPAQLAVKPPVPDSKPSISTVIGPKAKKPWCNPSPILIPNIPCPLEISREAKLAIASGAKKSGIAFGGSFTDLSQPDFERTAEGRLILEICDGLDDSEGFGLQSAALAEIKIGQGANPSVVWIRKPLEQDADKPSARKDPGQPVYSPAFYHFRSVGELAKTVDNLRKATGGIPIGVKIAAGSNLEDDLAVILKADPDFIALEGAEAGGSLVPAITSDGFGLPLRFAIPRADNFLKEMKAREKVSLIASGGLRTPLDMLKAMALGADSIYCGTGCLLAMLQTQSTKVLPFSPLRSIISPGKGEKKLDTDKASDDLHNFIKSCSEELEMGLQALGKSDISETSPADLIALTPELAKATGAHYAGRM